MEHIVGARFILQGHRILNSNDESKLVHELREICHASKYNVTVFHPYFIYFDQVIYSLLMALFLTSLSIHVIISVSCCAPNHNPVCGHRGGRDDVRLPDLHPQPGVLALGGLLHRVHRDRGAGLHDILGHQS